MDDPTHDALFRAMAEPHRRVVCRYLSARDEGVADFDDLVEHVVRRERAREDVEPEDVEPEDVEPEDVEPEDVEPGDRRRQVEIRLYHVHLPMLSDAGVVEFDARSGTVRYRGGGLIDALLCGLSEDGKVCA
jgi:hypothetical protein